MGRKIEKLMLLMGLHHVQDHFHCKLSGYRALWDELKLRYGPAGLPVSGWVGPALKQVALGDRAIGICNTGFTSFFNEPL